MIDILISDLVDETSKNLTGFKSPEEIEGSEKLVVAFSPGMNNAVTQVRDFLFDRVYTHPIAERMSSKASLILERIFLALTKDIEKEGSDSMKLLPYATQEHVKLSKDPVKRLQVVVDFMAGMTDRFASEFYRILFEPEERGITSLY